ncbi:MAG: hypothetical protein RLZZ535_948 [Cyanobacteriota bacterium]
MSILSYFLEVPDINESHLLKPHNDRRRLTQAWGKYFYDHPKKYSNIDGIIFSSAKNSEDAFAFYERVASKITSAKISTQSMKNDALKKEIRLAAKKLHIPIKFN